MDQKLNTNIFMIQVAKKLDLSESPLCIHIVVESIRYLLQRHHLISLRVQNGASTNKQKKEKETQTNQYSENPFC